VNSESERGDVEEKEKANLGKNTVNLGSFCYCIWDGGKKARRGKNKAHYTHKVSSVRGPYSVSKYPLGETAARLHSRM